MGIFAPQALGEERANDEMPCIGADGSEQLLWLAVAVAITLFGADWPAALATVVGVLAEVPVMLSVCKFCNRTRHWFEPSAVPAKIWPGLNQGSR